MENQWNVIEFDKPNFDDISELRDGFEAKEVKSNRRTYSPNYYDWKLRKNPFSNGTCKVIESEGKPVGLATVTPKQIFIRGRLIDGAEIGDTFTHPNFQRKGIFSAVVNGARSASISKNIEFIFGTPNDQSLPGYQKKCEFETIPAVRAMNMVLPLRIGPILNTKLKNPFLANLAALPLSWGLGAWTAVRAPKVKNKIQFVEAKSFPTEVDELWRKVSQNYDWMIARTRQYLQWRFVENPDNYTIFLGTEGSAFKGYVVLKIGTWSNLRVGYIADFLIDESNPTNFTQLVKFVRNHFKQAGIDMISCWIPEGKHSGVLRQFGFRKYKDVPVICYKNNLGKELIESCDRWYFTISDSDNI